MTRDWSTESTTLGLTTQRTYRRQHEKATDRPNWASLTTHPQAVGDGLAMSSRWRSREHGDGIAGDELIEHSVLSAQVRIFDAEQARR